MEDAREQSNGPSDALRRDAGPAPEFALVRPFVAPTGGGQPNRSVVTADSLDATQEIPMAVAYEHIVAYERPTVVNGRSLTLPLILAAAVLLAGGVVAVYAMTSWSGPGTVAAGPGPGSDVVLPADTPSDDPSPTSTPTDTGHYVGGGGGSGTHTHAPSPSVAPTPPSPSPSISFGLAAAPPTPVDPLSPPPAAPVTGLITGIAGLCADDHNRISDNGTAIQVFGCNGTPAQDWTVYPDATVRVLGKCMQANKPAAGAAVVQWDCSGDPGQAWRRGPANSLVNVATGLCLDDPNSSQDWGTQLDIAVCTGAANQSWNVPH
jgi:hypothetical protein